MLFSDVRAPLKKRNATDFDERTGPGQAFIAWANRGTGSESYHNMEFGAAVPARW